MKNKTIDVEQELYLAEEEKTVDAQTLPLNSIAVGDIINETGDLNGGISVMCYGDGDGTCDDCEGLNTMQTAIYLPLATWRSGSIAYSGAEVWYRFTATASNATQYTISTSGSLDTMGYLYNSNGTLITSNDDTSGNRNFSITGQLTYGTTYYIKVKAYSNNTGSYSIRVSYDTESSSNDNCDSSNDQSTAIQLNLNSWRSDQITCPGAAVWYKFTPSVTTHYTIYTAGALDTIGYLYDSNNSQIGVNDDGGSALNFRLSCYLTANQTYYIKIETHSSNIGYFNMVIVDKAFIESIEIDDLYVELTKGQSTRLTATVSPSYATNQTLRWDTSDSNIVSVNANTGEITAVNGGTAMVCAYSQDGSGKSSCCEVVVKVPVESVTVNTETKLMHVGESDSLSVTVCPENATNRLVYWTSSNNDVAVISSATGRVTAKGVGTANIYATAEDGSGKQGVCVLTVEPPIAVQGIEFCSDNYTMNVGETTYLSYDIYPSNATNQTVTWSSNNTRVATVNSISGLVTAVDTGDVIITATTEDGNFNASCTIVVEGYNYFNKTNTDNITQDFINLLGDKKIDIPVMDLFYTHTTSECVNIIINHDDIITNIANELKVHKAFIQTILMRELWCLNLADIAGDELVQNYYAWKDACAHWESQDVLYQAIVPYPTQPTPLKTDSSIGLGQIFASVAISAYNKAINLGYVCGTNIDSNDWRQCKTVWFSLRDDNEYNIRMCALNILSCIDEFCYSHNYEAYSENECKQVFTRYNANLDTINDYGQECYQYYLIFKNYL